MSSGCSVSVGYRLRGSEWLVRMCRLRNKGPGCDDNAGGERRYSCQVTNGWLARAGRDGGGFAGMGELAKDFYISSSERRGGSGRLAGGCVESGASKVWPGFLQEERGRCC